MQGQVTTRHEEPPSEPKELGARLIRCERVLRNALQKRELGVPTYTVPEAAALLSRSREHLYRLIRAGAFPAVGMTRGRRGDYVVPAKAVEAMLDAATATGAVVNAADFGSIGGAP